MGRACHRSVKKPRPIGDSLGRYRLDQLSITERSSLEQDLASAAEVQQQLLPDKHLRFDGWEISYRYKALGPVGGDYCDSMVREGGEKELLLALGDASGKGVTASLLMARLHAVFHSLSLTNLRIAELVEAANRVLCQHTANSSFATLVCVRANSAGDVEICNAGHCPPLLIGAAGITPIDSGGFPLGLFPAAQYSVTRLHLANGESLFFYTDGLTEARDRNGDEYGDERLRQEILQSYSLSPPALIETCMEHLTTFLEGMPLTDDMTVMGMRHVD
jgi:sigma-B regulation protein RsbU (phosphoserine phosphatase)